MPKLKYMKPKVILLGMLSDQAQEYLKKLVEQSDFVFNPTINKWKVIFPKTVEL